jgi:predicted kinase
VIRKELVGLRPLDRAGAPLDEGIYTPTSGDRTYTELLERARRHLAAGTSVVLDASWAETARRTAAQALADDTASELVQIECQAPEPVRRERAAARVRRGDDASDVGPRLAAWLDARFATWPEAVKADTDRAPDVVARAVLDHVSQHTCSPT